MRLGDAHVDLVQRQPAQRVARPVGAGGDDGRDRPSDPGRAAGMTIGAPMFRRFVPGLLYGRLDSVAL